MPSTTTLRWLVTAIASPGCGTGWPAHPLSSGSQRGKASSFGKPKQETFQMKCLLCLHRLRK